jgi:renalase
MATMMTAALQGVLGEPIDVVHAVAHRWRYALPDPVAPTDALYDAQARIGAAGDWCAGPRVEGALLSGCALAGRVLTQAHVEHTSMHVPASLFDDVSGV